MHYLDEGRGEPVVMLHGNPTWSFYYRELIGGLAPDYRGIAPDHIGCGLSDKPTDADTATGCRPRRRPRGPAGPVSASTGRSTLVLHDWGGMIGTAFAVRHPERVARLVVLNTAAFLRRTGKRCRGRSGSCARSRSSPPAVLRLNLFARGAAWTTSARGLAPAVRRGHLAPYDSSRNRLATLRFVQDIPLSPADPSYALAALIDQGLARFQANPVLVCWGERDFVFDLDYLAEWQRRFPRAEIHRFPQAGHYVLEDEPGPILALVRDFLSRTPAAD